MGYHPPGHRTLHVAHQRVQQRDAQRRGARARQRLPSDQETYVHAGAHRDAHARADADPNGNPRSADGYFYATAGLSDNTTHGNTDGTSDLGSDNTAHICADSGTDHHIYPGSYHAADVHANGNTASTTDFYTVTDRGTDGGTYINT